MLSEMERLWLIASHFRSTEVCLCRYASNGCLAIAEGLFTKSRCYISGWLHCGIAVLLGNVSRLFALSLWGNSCLGKDILP